MVERENELKTEKTSEYWIEVAKRAGIAAHHGFYSGPRRTWATFCRIGFPRAMIRPLAARRDGTLTAAERAFSVGLREGR